MQVFRIDPRTLYTKPPPRRQRAADVEPRPGPHSPTLSPRRAKSRRRRSGTGTGLLLALLLLCAAGGLPLAAAQTTTSGEEDAAALREAKAAAHTSAPLRVNARGVR